jgi:glycosyltransferase involved in cell wall biosynthesis
MKAQGFKISLIIPVYNESENLYALHAEIVREMAGVNNPWEILLVDDGSSDNSLEVIKSLAEADSRVRFISFEKNCGQSAAFAAGFRFASGDVLVTLDADLQNDPADIPAMLQVYAQGADMVIGWRAERQDSFVKRCASRFANWVRNIISRETVRDTGCSLKVMRADMAGNIPMFTGMHRFLPTLMKMQGALVEEMRVNHRPRYKGVSKYGIWDRAWAAAHDLLAVRWMQKRHFRYTVTSTNITNTRPS